MEGKIYEECAVMQISKVNGSYSLRPSSKKVISEISLKIFVNEVELVSLLCLNQCQEELAIGFLYNEGVINSYDDILSIYYDERMFAVIVKLKDNIPLNRQESLRSITSGCGRCFTYINPLKKNKYLQVKSETTFSISTIVTLMNDFINQSEIFKDVGGVHSVLFHTPDYSIMNEDIGRHNCFDKITGMLLKNRRINLSSNSIVFVSGRISSEIMTKIIRLGTPVLVSRSTPTVAAVSLAQEYNVTILGYVRGEKGYVYTCPERLTS
ncbi:MAG: formate dehydrogenase accessory sulfurtransferase FdhD [Bacillota bacterium]